MNNKIRYTVENIIKKLLFTCPCNKCLVLPCCSRSCIVADKWMLKYYKIYTVYLIVSLVKIFVLLSIPGFIKSIFLSISCWSIGALLMLFYAFCIPNPKIFEDILREKVKPYQSKIK
jgi:hypothetical protein